MNSLALGEELSPYRLISRNYAPDSENKIHGDEVARLHGFSGGLVPGIAVYAYMTKPVVEALGHDWLARGTMKAKSLKPVYEGEAVTVRARVAEIDPMRIEIQVLDSMEILRAVGEAAFLRSTDPPKPDDYPDRPAPPLDQRLHPSISVLRPGSILGSFHFRWDSSEVERTFVRDVHDPLPIYRGPDAACHPAFLLAQANFILRDNVDLGPWIHTASEVRHFAEPRDGEPLSLRGKIADAFEKRGNEFVVCDLAIFGEEERAIQTIKHSAIVRLR